MAIITISRGSYSKGREIAEKVADKLGYECISRDILIEASKQFNIPEIKLVRAIHDAPSVLERFSYGKEKYVAYIRKAILEHAQKGNMVYHGLAGHFFFKDIPCVLKVRIIADMESRVREEINREHISAEEARFLLHKDDEERRKWALHLYRIDTWDSRLYDLVINIRSIQVNEAVDCICKFAERPAFTPSTACTQRIKEALLESKCKIALVNDFPKAEINIQGQMVNIYLDKGESLSSKQEEKIKDLLKDIPEIEDVRIKVAPILIPD